MNSTRKWEGKYKEGEERVDDDSTAPLSKITTYAREAFSVIIQQST